MERKLAFSELSPFIRIATKGDICRPDFYTDRTRIALDFRLNYVLRGLGTLELDGRREPLRPGTVMFIRSGTPYRFVPEGGELEIYLFNFDFTSEHSDVKRRMNCFADDELLPHPLEENLSISDAPEFDQSFILADAGFLEASFAEIYDEHKYKRIHYSSASGGLMFALLAKVGRAWGLRSGPAGVRESLMSEILDYITANCALDISYEDLSERFRFHPVYLNRIIKEYTGLTLHKYITGCRIALASELLSSTGLTISEIAQRCGFPDAKYFAKRYKAETGQTPAALRRHSDA